MNKKFSTLVAGLLLATSFGAFAANELQITEGQFKSGSTYFLTTTDDPTSASALVVKGAELQMVKWKVDAATTVTEIEEMTKIEREYAMWTVTSKKVIGGGLAYEFANKATGQKLQVSAAAPGVAFTANGVNQFKWITLTGTATNAITTATALTNDAGTNTVQLQQAYVIGDAGLTTTAAVNFDALTRGKNQTRLMEYILAANRSAENTTLLAAISFAGTSGDAATASEVTAAKKAVAGVDALLTSLGLKRETFAAYKTFAVAVDALVVPAAAGTVDATTAEAALANAKAAIAAGLDANDYGWKITETAGGVSGVVYAANGASIAAASTTYKKGTIFVTDFAVLPTLMPETKMTATSSTLVEDDKVYEGEFSREFNTGNQEKKDVVAVLGFDGPTAETNVLADVDFQIVKRNLLAVNSTGRVSNTGALTDGDFASTSVIMDKKSGKYLVVKTDTYEPGSASSTYYKLGWADLDAYSDKDLTKTAKTTYSKAKGNLVAAYMFNVTYNANNDSLTIKPAFNIAKTSTTNATDTVGTSYAMSANTDLVLSLKQFSNAVEMTTLDPLTQKAYRINTGATASGSGWEITSKSSDVYFIQYISELASKKVDNEKFFTADPTVTDNLVKSSIENLNCIPYAQWALVKDASGVVTIKNRVTNEVFEDKEGNKFENAQLYKAGGELVSVFKGDTLKLTSVASVYKTDSTLGYFAHNAKQNEVLKYKLTYFNELDATKNVSYNKDSVMLVDTKGDGMWFQVLPVKGQIAKEFGPNAIENVSKKLARTQYTMFTKINGDTCNVVYNTTTGKFEISASTSAKAASKFFIKTMMHADTCWYVLENVDASATIWNKVSVNDNTLELFGGKDTEKRTSMFALKGEDAPKYRRFGATLASDGIAKNDTAYVEFFKADEPTRFLFENTKNKVAGNGTGISKDSLNFLGMYNKADFKVNPAIYVDTAYLRNDTIKPLYMLAMDVTYVPSTSIPCPIDGSLNCPHHKEMANAYKTGRYLVALHDSVAGNASARYQGDTRLAFVPAKHIGDTLVINKSIFTGVKNKTANDSLIVKGDNMTAATFAFRLVNDDPADFYIESIAADGEKAYVRIHNGIPVLVKDITVAAIFNTSKSEVRPTDNEGINATEVSVVAGAGSVTINNAAGKAVVISNILGQTIANTTITSDNETITVPAGIVVVSVDGEAVKAIVK